MATIPEQILSLLRENRRSASELFASDMFARHFEGYTAALLRLLDEGEIVYDADGKLVPAEPATLRALKQAYALEALIGRSKDRQILQEDGEELIKAIHLWAGKYSAFVVTKRLLALSDVLKTACRTISAGSVR